MSDGSRIAVTVDVEDWYHLPAVTGAPDSLYGSVGEFFADWDGRFDYLTECTHRTLDVLDEFDVTATFFVVADIVDQYPGLVERIAERGHEIGCHGLHHACAIDPRTGSPLFEPDEYRDRIVEAKSTLEAASGQDVTGFRAPNAYVGGWVLDVLEEAGFEYDSSVTRNSVYNKTDSELTGVGSSPYVPAAGALIPGRDRSFVELPWPYFELAGYRLPTAGGPLIRLMGATIVRRGLAQSASRGDTLFYFHPLDIARERFPILGGAKRRAFWAFRGAVAERRVRSVLRWIGPERAATCGELAKHKLKERQRVGSGTEHS